MTRNKWVTRTLKVIMLLAPGTILLGTSCGASVRDSAITAGADFVGTSIGKILDALVPVDTLLANTGT